MEKQLYNALSDFPSYSDALAHIAKHHGARGRDIVEDPNSAPFIWHEFAHVDPTEGADTWDHEHVGSSADNPQELAAKVAEIVAMIESNPLELAKLINEALKEEQ